MFIESRLVGGDGGFCELDCGVRLVEIDDCVCYTSCQSYICDKKRKKKLLYVCDCMWIGR